MKIAECKDAAEYAFLGVDRLDYLCSFVDVKVDKPIKTLIDRHELVKCLDNEDDREHFKRCVDLVIACERLKKDNIDFNPIHVDHLNSITGFKFDKTLMKRLSEIKNDEKGDTKEFIRKLSLNNGVIAEDDKSPKKPEDFNALGTRMLQTIEKMLKDPNSMNLIEKSIFESVVRKLDELKLAAKIS
jgi:hypothetical protein